MSESKIPGYRLLKKAGRGGMASVYLAIQEAVGRSVALKILPKKVCKDNSFSTLFLQEANCGILNHPNIISIFDAGETEDFMYIAMEFLHGGDLKQKIKSGLNQNEIINIVTKISEALAYAHSKGFIHRDIKPSNILINEDNQPILCDFGIARAISFSNQTVTDGMLMGTPHYTSPEQISGGVVDQRSDLYSLGVVYYEMLMGEKPFTADTPYALIYKHLEEKPPELDIKFKQHQPIVHKLMAKKPDDRYASAFDLIEDLVKLTQAKKEEDALRKARMSTYKKSAVLLTLVLAFSIIISDRLTAYTEKQLAKLRTSVTQSQFMSLAFKSELQAQRALLAESENEIQMLDAQIKKNKSITLHLEKAAKFMQKSQYITPVKKSALSEYNIALSLDPDNYLAKSGIRLIVSHYILLAKNESIKGVYFEALDHINSGLIASPNDTQLVDMREAIIKRLDLSGKRMQLESDLLLAKDLIKKEKFDDAIQKLEFLRVISKQNQRILSLLSHANEQKLKLANSDNESEDETVEKIAN